MNTQSDDQDSNTEHRTAILVAAGYLMPRRRLR